MVRLPPEEDTDEVDGENEEEQEVDAAATAEAVAKGLAFKFPRPTIAGNHKDDSNWHKKAATEKTTTSTPSAE